MITSGVVSEVLRRARVAYPSEAAISGEGDGGDLDGRVGRCLNAIRAEASGDGFDEKTIATELALLEGWLRANEHGSVVSTSVRSIALYIVSGIQEGMPREKVARRVSFLRRFYACMRQLGLRADDPMAEVRIYGMFGGASQRY